MITWKQTLGKIKQGKGVRNAKTVRGNEVRGEQAAD